MTFTAFTEAELRTLLIGWQAWVAQGITDDLGGLIWLGKVGDILVILVQGSFYGDKAEFEVAAKGMLDALPSNPTTNITTYTDWKQSLEFISTTQGSLDTSAPESVNLPLFQRDHDVYANLASISRGKHFM